MAATDDDDLQQEIDQLKRRQVRREKVKFARGMMRGILSMLKPGDIVIDCGAHVGRLTEQFADTGATVHAFEPDPYAFEQLSARLDGAENVVLHKAAVGLRTGAAKLMRPTIFDKEPKSASARSTVVTGAEGINEDPAAAIEIEMMSLPDFVREQADAHGQVALLKLDIRGAELAILEHMLLRDLFDRIRLTLAATHEKEFPDVRPRFKALRSSVADKYPITQVNLDWI